MAGVVCTTKGAALAALDFIASIMPKGMQRDTLIAVKTWIAVSTTEGYINEETLKKLKSIFEEEGDSSVKQINNSGEE
jgi:hypothetical protein